MSEPPSSKIEGISAGELLARGLHSVRVSSGGNPLGWVPPTLDEVAGLFPHYEVNGLLGHGGMGAVYLVRQTMLDRLVAVKLLPMEISVDPDFAARFRREARAMARLNHPNIVAVYDFGETQEGQLFFVMEYVDGDNLHRLIHSGEGLSHLDVLTVLGQICDALSYAHAEGVVHRDIKPANVLIDRRGGVKVADFGLARLVETNPEAFGVTQTGMVMGTPDYMAPEQKRGTQVDHRADIYSLGVILYEALCKEIPEGAFEMPSKRCGIDKRIDLVVSKALAQQPVTRFQSTAELKTALEAVRPSVMRAHRHSHGVPHPGVPPPRIAAKHELATASQTKISARRLGAIAAGLLLLGGVVFLIGHSGERKPAVRSVPKAAAASAVPASAGKPAPAGEGVAAAREKIPESALPPPVTAAAPPASTPPPASVPEVAPPAAPLQPVLAEKPMAPSKEAPSGPKVPKEGNAGGKASPEVVQWLGEMDARFTGQWQKEAVEPFENSVRQLRGQYAAAVERNMSAASQAGKLDDALAWRNEKARLEAGGEPHESPDGAGDPPALKQLREAWRKKYSALDSERFAHSKAVQQIFDSLLAKGQTGYTQKSRFEDALLLKNKRDEIAAAWLSPPADLKQPALPTVAKTPDSTTTGGTLSGRRAVEMILSCGATVDVLSGGQEKHLAKTEDIPAGRLEITRIVFASKKPDGNPVTDADLAQLGTMPALRTFEASGEISGSGLRFLSSAHELETLSLGSSTFTDTSFEPILALRKLQTLHINPTGNGKPFSYGRLAQLASLPTLTSMGVGRLRDDDAAFLEALPRARRLLELGLGQCQLGRKGMAVVASLPQLNSLTVNVSIEFSDCLGSLEKSQKITRMGLIGSELNTLAFVAKMRHLESLTIDCNAGAILDSAAGAAELKFLSFYGAGNPLHDETLEAICHGFPRLEELDFGVFSHTFSIEQLKKLSALPNLATIHWRPQGLDAALLGVFASLPALASLDVASTPIKDEDLAGLSGAKALQKLDLTGCVNITPACVDYLKAIPKLRQVSVAGTLIKAEDMRTLQRALPKCRLVGAAE